MNMWNISPTVWRVLFWDNLLYGMVVYWLPRWVQPGQRRCALWRLKHGGGNTARHRRLAEVINAIGC